LFLKKLEKKAGAEVDLKKLPPTVSGRFVCIRAALYYPAAAENGDLNAC
jgi:hypothetical protein